MISLVLTIKIDISKLKYEATKYVKSAIKYCFNVIPIFKFIGSGQTPFFTKVTYVCIQKL